MDKAVRDVLTKTCNYDDLHNLVLEKMKQINIIVSIKAESEAELVHFLLNSVAAILKKKLVFSSVLTSVVELGLPENAITRSVLDHMYRDVSSKMTEHDFDKIALDHYDNKDNWLCDNLKDDAILKCIILKFCIEITADLAVHFNSGGDAELLEKLKADPDHSLMLQAINEISSEYAVKFRSMWN